MREKIYEICRGLDGEIDFNSKELVDGGLLDSVTLVEVISEIMEELDVDIPFEEITPANFNSVDAMAALVEKYV